MFVQAWCESSGNNKAGEYPALLLDAKVPYGAARQAIAASISVSQSAAKFARELFT